MLNIATKVYKGLVDSWLKEGAEYKKQQEQRIKELKAQNSPHSGSMTMVRKGGFALGLMNGITEGIDGLMTKATGKTKWQRLFGRGGCGGKKALKGGKFDAKHDIVDFLAGPWGWLKMAERKKRDREIERLGGQRIYIPSTDDMSDEAFDKMMEERRNNLMKYDPGAFHRSGGTYRQLIYPRLERQRRKRARAQAENTGGAAFL